MKHVYRFYFSYHYVWKPDYNEECVTQTTIYLLNLTNECALSKYTTEN